MGDLISREDVIQTLKETGIIQDNDRGHLVVDEINRIPTAYDVDKVVTEIKQSTTDDEGLLVRDGKEPMIWKSKAIEIVRKGGVE